MKEKKKKVNVLLIEDDEEDYILVRDMLSEIDLPRYRLDWASTYGSGLDQICLDQHAVYLVDYRLGDRTGLDLLTEAMERGCQGPIILLTGQGGIEVDMEALRNGAADFIAKAEMTGPLLDRSIRYAIAHRKILNDLRESESRGHLLSIQLLAAQERERRNMATEIHDSIGSSLAAIKFRVESILAKMEERHPLCDSLKDIIPFIQETIEEARRIQMNLRPSILDDFGILATINWFCRQFTAIHPAVSLSQEIGVDEKEVPEPLKIVIFRILQEAFTNIAKHSRASRIVVCLEKNDREIELAVRDNGVGFQGKKPSEGDDTGRGLGLESMTERAELSGGTFAIESTAKGTSLSVKWDLKKGSVGIFECKLPVEAKKGPGR